MFRFTIRDLLWLMLVVAACLAWLANSRRWALIEAKLQVAEHRAAASNARYEAIAEENKTTTAVFEALSETYRQVKLTADQRDTFGEVFKEDLRIRDVEITPWHCSVSATLKPTTHADEEAAPSAAE